MKQCMVVKNCVIMQNGFLLHLDLFSSFFISLFVFNLLWFNLQMLLRLSIISTPPHLFTGRNGGGLPHCWNWTHVAGINYQHQHIRHHHFHPFIDVLSRWSRLHHILCHPWKLVGLPSGSWDPSCERQIIGLHLVNFNIYILFGYYNLSVNLIFEVESNSRDFPSIFVSSLLTIVFTPWIDVDYDDKSNIFLLFYTEEKNSGIAFDKQLQLLL